VQGKPTRGEREVYLTTTEYDVGRAIFATQPRVTIGKPRGQGRDPWPDTVRTKSTGVASQGDKVTAVGEARHPDVESHR